jgi:lipoyl(octanoyl) transferase
MQSWHLLLSPAADAATNMAVDEALWRHAAQRGRPLLRLYSWSQPAVSIGYFQKFPARLAGKYALVRRPTGGGVVYHVDDTTYTVVVPPAHELYRFSTQDAYCVLHKAVAAALTVASSLTPHDAPPARGQYECFEKPVAGDVVADGGRKLAGGAQRRGKAGMLHQGSIAARVSVDQLTKAFRQVLQAEFERYELTPVELALAEKLAREKYSTAAWNQKLTQQ